MQTKYFSSKSVSKATKLNQKDLVIKKILEMNNFHAETINVQEMSRDPRITGGPWRLHRGSMKIW